MSVPSPWTTLTLTQGATSVEIPLDAAQELNHDEQEIDRYEVLRAIDLSGILHVNHGARRRRFQFAGQGAIPLDLDALTLPGIAELLCPTLGVGPWTVIVHPAVRRADAHSAVSSWTLLCEEA